MFYYFLLPLSTDYRFLHLLHYITFRSWGAAMTALLICFLAGPRLITWLKQKQQGGQPIREDGPKSHLLTKKGTPTMGGVMIFLAVIVSTLLWANLGNPYIWVTLFVMIGFGALGFWDDYLKVTKKNTKGVSGRRKLLIQTTIALIAALWIQMSSSTGEAHFLAFPFLKSLFIDLGWFYLPFAMLVMVGASNAVNLTDGLDGLAIGPIMIAMGCFALISYLVGHIKFADYLYLHFVSGAGELSVLCAAVIGAGLGFLWFNAPPAKVFMGDTGSLALGGALGTMSVITKHEIVLAIIGGLFVMEAVSVMIQVGYFKMTGGKRFFGMAPIHHHFEKKGWSEPTVVIRFWIISVIFALIGLASLKLR